MDLFRKAVPFDPMQLAISLRGWICFLVIVIGGLWSELPVEPLLGEIRQLTFEHMGLDRAGEGYVSPDGAWIAFQAVPRGETHYQI